MFFFPPNDTLFSFTHRLFLFEEEKEDVGTGEL